GFFHGMWAKPGDFDLWLYLRVWAGKQESRTVDIQLWQNPFPSAIDRAALTTRFEDAEVFDCRRHLAKP
ncbi:MAG: hypothetical protein J6S85_25030, partial [Methanobrevibacter sp.]|nr:hypothetical protein [Methanobrevibacter sp.]